MSIRSVIERDRNQRVLASIDSCCLSCRIVGIIKYILSYYVMLRKTRKTLLPGGILEIEFRGCFIYFEVFRSCSESIPIYTIVIDSATLELPLLRGKLTGLLRQRVS